MKRTAEIDEIMTRWDAHRRRQEAVRQQQRRLERARELRQRLAAEQAEAGVTVVAESAAPALTTPTRRLLAEVLEDIGGMTRPVAEGVAGRVPTETEADAIIAARGPEMVALARRWLR